MEVLEAVPRNVQLDRLCGELTLFIPTVGFCKVFHEFLYLPRGDLVEPHVTDSFVNARLQEMIASDRLRFQLDLRVVLEPLTGEVLELDRSYHVPMHTLFLEKYDLPLQFFLDLL